MLANWKGGERRCRRVKERWTHKVTKVQLRVILTILTGSVHYSQNCSQRPLTGSLPCRLLTSAVLQSKSQGGIWWEEDSVTRQTTFWKAIAKLVTLSWDTDVPMAAWAIARSKQKLKKWLTLSPKLLVISRDSMQYKERSGRFLMAGIQTSLSHLCLFPDWK